MSLEERRQAMKLTDKQTDGNNFCPICGYPLGNHNPWGDDGKTPTYDICPCCGVEWGNEDYTTESQESIANNGLNREPNGLNLRKSQITGILRNN